MIGVMVMCGDDVCVCGEGECVVRWVVGGFCRCEGAAREETRVTRDAIGMGEGGRGED